MKRVRKKSLIVGVDIQKTEGYGHLFTKSETTSATAGKELSTKVIMKAANRA